MGLWIQKILTFLLKCCQIPGFLFCLSLYEIGPLSQLPTLIVSLRPILMESVEIIATQLNRQIKFDLNSFVEKKHFLLTYPFGPLDVAFTATKNFALNCASA